MLSIVIPIHNEEPSILPLYDRLNAVLEKLHKPFEIIFVDDASTDRSFDWLMIWLALSGGVAEFNLHDAAEHAHSYENQRH